LGFSDADYLSGHADPDFKIVLDKVASVTSPSPTSFLIRMKSGETDMSFKSSNEDAKDAAEWRELITSLIP